MANKIVVIGGGAAGMSAASAARAADSKANIKVITADEDVAYSPCMIPWVLGGKYTWKSMIMHTPDWYATNRRIEVITKTTVDQIVNGKGEKYVLCKKKKYKFDNLVIATGGVHFVPPVEGRDLRGVFTLKSIRDGKNFQAYLKKVKARRIVVVGAGVLGLEVADGLNVAGYDVTVIEMMKQIVPRLADQDMAALMQARIEAKKIKAVVGAPLERVNGKEFVDSVTAGGKRYACDAVVFATGIRANLEVPKMLDLDLGQLDAVTVSPTMQPYSRGRLVPNVFLAGDVVQVQSAVYSGPTMSQLGSSAVKGGKVAGANAAGMRREFGPTVSPWVTRIAGFEMAAAGMSQGLASWYGTEVVAGRCDGLTRARYYDGALPMAVKVLADRTSHRIVGAQIVAGEGTTGRIDWLAEVIRQSVTAEEFLVCAENAYCPPTSMVVDPIICAVEDLAKKLQ